MKTYKVNNLEITESQVKRLAIEAGFLKEEKPLNRLYIDTCDGDVYIYFTSETDSFGFYEGEWDDLNSNNKLSSSFWTLATEEDQKQWESLLIKHAESKGYKNGNYNCLFTTSLNSTNNCEKFKIKGINVWTDGLGNNQVFDGSTGKWAEIIKTVSVQEEWDKLTPDERIKILGTIALKKLSRNALLRVIGEYLDIDNIDINQAFTIR